MNHTNLLVIDDDDLYLKSIAKELSRTGFAVRTAPSGQAGLRELSSRTPDVVLLDMRLPDVRGTELLKSIKKQYPATQVVMLTAYGSIDSAVEALKLGAFHYLVKPAKLTEIESVIRMADDHRRLKVENRSLKDRLRAQFDRDVIVGESPKMQALLEIVEKVAATDQTVLIEGESGTGKELLARRIHRRSSRCDKPFVLLDCASLNRGLLENELFGHEKGAFTGAAALKHGLIEAAHTGTLFVDEVGCLESSMQSDFLRLMEAREYRRVGGTETRRADVRIVAATNVDLRKASLLGQFREDLFFRLSVFGIRIPPLRERKEDIPLLARYFLGASKCSVGQKEISPEAFQVLQDYEWPGNVRELKNVIERAALLTEGGLIKPRDLHLLALEDRNEFDPIGREEEILPLRKMQDRYIRFVLEKVNGHQGKAAKILGVDPKTIYRLLKKQ